MSLLHTNAGFSHLLCLGNVLLTQEGVECVLCAEHGAWLLFLVVDERDEVVGGGHGGKGVDVWTASGQAGAYIGRGDYLGILRGMWHWEGEQPLRATRRGTRSPSPRGPAPVARV